MLKIIFMAVLTICLLVVPYQASAASSVASSVKNAEKVAAQVNTKISVTSASKITKLDANLVKKLKTNLNITNKKVKALKSSKTKTTYTNKLKKVTTIYKNALTYQKVYNQGTKVQSRTKQLESASSSKSASLKKLVNKELSTFKSQIKTFYNNKTKAAFVAKYQTPATSALSDTFEIVEIK